MSDRTVTVRVFCSAKGGVGKSTLAVAAAKLLAKQGHAVALIDADLTGTSLADGLDLCAPRVALDSEGRMDFTTADGAWLSRPESDTARNARRVQKNRADSELAPPPPYLTDLLVLPLEEDRSVPLERLCWHMKDDGVRYFPSSPLAHDIGLALGWFAAGEELAWIQRVAWFMDVLLERLPALDEIVFDVPPGLFGFGLELMKLLSHLGKMQQLHGMPPTYPPWGRRSIAWVCDPVLVTSQDRNDLWTSLDWFVENRSQLPQLRMLANRHTKPVPVLRQLIRERLEGLKLPTVEIPLQGVGLVQGTLGRIFSEDHDLRLNDEVLSLAPAILGGSVK